MRCQVSYPVPVTVLAVFSLNGDQILIEGLNLTFKGQLLEVRICSLGSKFFSERVDLSFEELYHPGKQKRKSKKYSPFEKMAIFPYTSNF